MSTTDISIVGGHRVSPTDARHTGAHDWQNHHTGKHTGKRKVLDAHTGNMPVENYNGNNILETYGKVEEKYWKSTGKVVAKYWRAQQVVEKYWKYSGRHTGNDTGTRDIVADILERILATTTYWQHILIRLAKYTGNPGLQHTHTATQRDTNSGLHQRRIDVNTNSSGYQRVMVTSICLTMDPRRYFATIWFSMSCPYFAGTFGLFFETALLRTINITSVVPRLRFR